MQTQELLDRYEYTTKLQRTEIARLVPLLSARRKSSHSCLLGSMAILMRS